MPMRVEKTNRTCQRQRGFTLLEICIALLVIALLAAPIFAYYAQHEQRRKIETTNKNLASVRSALELYHSAHGHYPCPASVTAGRDHGIYGETSAFCGEEHEPGTCLQGLCTLQSPRLVDLDMDEATPPEEINVVFGAVPFRELQIEEEESLDGYGSKLVYAVTQPYTMLAGNINTENAGGIDIFSAQNSVSIFDAEQGLAIFAVYSLGPNRKGGYNTYGVSTGPCPTATPQADEADNCLSGYADGTEGERKAILTVSLLDNSEDDNEFDDKLLFTANRFENFWNRSTFSADDIYDLNTQAVGVGSTVPEDLEDGMFVATDDTTESLRVYGSNVTDGSIFTDQICDSSGNTSNCISTALLTADTTTAEGQRIECPDDKPYLAGLRDSDTATPGFQPDCRAVIDVRCPADKPVLNAVQADGTITCRMLPLTNCAAAVINIKEAGPNEPENHTCGIDAHLPEISTDDSNKIYKATGPGNTATIFGYNRDLYLPNTSEHFWVDENYYAHPMESGKEPYKDDSCLVSLSYTCGDVSASDGDENNGLPNGGWVYKGRKFDNGDKARTACLPTWQEKTMHCIEGDTDSPTYKEWSIILCNNNKILYQEPSESKADKCKCTESSTPITKTCKDAGYGDDSEGTLHATKYTHADCSTEIGPWTGECVCPEKTETETLSCPEGHTGDHYITKKRGLDCKWSETETNNCACGSSGIDLVFADCSAYNPPACYTPNKDKKIHYEYKLENGVCKRFDGNVEEGTCTAKSVTWQDLKRIGETDSIPPGANYIGQSCTCEQYSKKEVCYESGNNKDVFQCECR
ncbi:MAG: prepilin-type N-terminal cleavage/methylation domain-containing protein [Alphaproteobacteria bacterium]|nr:prepilin-type N-terminal cleavage/methylation domain-containing protein [Alphaproteobacteria bacterium]